MRLWLDVGPPDATTLVCGMGRSGTTWVAQLINHDRSYRVMFEPFFPARVPEAGPFEYIQYMRPTATDPARALAAKKILAGRLRNPAVDQGNRGFAFRRRIIKEIRCNLMLRWLAGVAPRMRIVLVVRDPLAVAASWLRLDWGREASGTRTDFEVITSQAALMEDFPELRTLAAEVDPDQPFDRILFQWCAFHLVPLRQFPAGELFIVRYEKLVRQPEPELARLFAHLGSRMDPDKLAAAFARPSSTADIEPGGRGNVEPSRSGPLSTAQIDRAHRMLERCGLHAMLER